MLVELELPWLMKEAALLEGSQIRGGPHSPGFYLTAGWEITRWAKRLAFGG